MPLPQWSLDELTGNVRTYGCFVRLPSVEAGAPLSGVVVVELGQSVAAPFAGQLLADLGAQVVKVEKPAGDDARRWGPPFLDGAAATFQALNRGKRSVVCELRDPVQRDALGDFIVARADVVLQNMRPGQVDELELGASALRARKPSLVYCNLGAFGRQGPLAGRPGYDPLMQAFGGIMSITGEAGRPPVRVGPSIVDIGTGLWCVVGVLLALYRRAESGIGGVVDVSLLETAAAWMAPFALQYLASGSVPGRNGSGQAGIVPYRAYPTADGDLVVAAGNDALFQKLCAAVGHRAWGDDERFATNPGRVANAAELDALLEPVMLTRTNLMWTRAFDEAGVPSAPVQDVGQLLAHEQIAALGMLQPLSGLSQPVLGPALSLDDERPLARTAPPELGEATFEQLLTG
jgi:crotonobetainyl-CoA:carnitine CoA-transferase CaiB-like acyl-CoA transferase